MRILLLRQDNCNKNEKKVDYKAIPRYAIKVKHLISSPKEDERSNGIE